MNPKNIDAQKKKAREQAEILCECEAEQTDPESSPFATSS